MKALFLTKLFKFPYWQSVY